MHLARRRTGRTLLSLGAPLAIAGLGWGCAPGDGTLDHADEPAVTEDEAPVGGGNVLQAISSGCSTAAIKPLSRQIAAEMACMDPSALAELPELPNVQLAEPVLPYLSAGARDALVRAANSRPNDVLQVSSMFRTVAQQVMIRRWYEQGRCGIAAAAQPGRSNHETGLAIDVGTTSGWRTALEAQGFDWFGSGDRPHFDFDGPDRRGLDVKAFQRLWNRNNQGDRIAEDGAFGPATRSRIHQSPAGGFALGASCEGGQDPVESDPEEEEGEPWTCDGSTGRTKIEGGRYVATSFGCGILADGDWVSDSGDNCIPACFNQLKQSGACGSSMSGPACERHINWYVADRDRFGCGAKLRVTNESNGRSAVVMVIDAGPACWVEREVDTGVLDMSYRATEYLFGGAVGWADGEKVKVEEVGAGTPLGPG